jgi:hypothetical protein
LFHELKISCPTGGWPNLARLTRPAASLPDSIAAKRSGDTVFPGNTG